MASGPGLEIVGFQSIKGFPQVSREFERRFKEAVERNELQPSCLGANVDLGRRIGELMDEDEIVEYMEPQLRAAATLGFPVVRMQFGAPPSVIERLRADCRTARRVHGHGDPQPPHRHTTRP